jgi:hypothetical protein
MDLTIHHLDCRYTVSRSQGGATMRSRLDEVAARLLPSMLSNQTGPFPIDDGAIYFVDQLQTSLTLRPSLTDYDLAGRWAESLSKALSDRLRRADDIIVFRNRAEFLSALLLDLAAGVADDVWYYRRFLQLTWLSGGARAERLLVEDPDSGRDALLDLCCRGRLEDLLQILDSKQLATVVERCLLPKSPEVVSPESYGRWQKAVLEVLAARHIVASASPARDTLVLYFEILRARPDLGPDVNLARFVWRVLELRSTCLGLPQLPSLLRSGDWTRVRPLLESVEQIRFLGSLLRAVPGNEIAAMVEHLQPDSRPAIERRLFTEYAGIFLLASSTLEVDWAKMGPLALYVTVLQCLGAPNLALTLTDPGVASFAGLNATPSPEELTAQLSSWDPLPKVEARSDPWFGLATPGGTLESFPTIDGLLQPLSETMLRSFLRRLGAFSESSPEYSYRNLLRCRGIVTVSAERIAIRFLTCPLRLVLRMAGFASSPIALPWAGNKLLEIDLD